jgi:hypothetical protein
VEKLAIACEVQRAELSGGLSDQVAFAYKHLVCEVGQRATTAPIGPADDHLTAPLVARGFRDPQDLHNYRLNHDPVSLSSAGIGLLAPLLAG